MNLTDFQKMIHDLYCSHDTDRGVEKTMLWLVEEVGELAEALRKGEEVGEEIADVLAWTVSIANLYNVDVEKEVKKKYPDHCIKCGSKPCRCEK
ncbi:MAG: MazG nucleotide pyrophosphohydrolase domain-containing protein [Archaeoglobaceae archaeon]